MVDRNRIYIVLGLVFALLIIIAAVFMFGGSKATLTPVNVTPENGATVSPEEALVSIEYDSQLSIVQDQDFSISITPDVDYVHGVLGNTLNISLSNLLYEPLVEYDLQISGLKNSSGDVLDTLTHKINVSLGSEASEFIESLPLENNNYSVVLLSDSVLYALISNSDTQRYEELILDQLSAVGITDAKFEYVIESSSAYVPTDAEIFHSD